MDAATLARAMGCSQAVADRYVADMNAAMIQAGCTTVNRAAMWCAQIGHESAGLKYMEEIASGQAYEGRRDLGNTQPGDGRRFKGRGPIQLTGRNNYGLFLRWCRDRGLNPPDLLADPAQVATPRWGFLAAAWYWAAARPKLNGYADAGDLTAATKAINGGTNGLTDRRTRWERCRAIGAALLPGGAAPPAPAASGAAGFRAEHGQVGAHVYRLAKFLNEKFGLYSNLPLDADPARQRYGDQTAAVIREFAKRSGIGAISGEKVGPQVAGALAKLGFRG